MGTMGPGIAAVLARGGWNVAAYDISPEQLEKARADLPTMNKVLALIGGPDKPGNVAFGTDLAAAVKDAALIVEAVPERPDLKKQVFAELDRLAAPAAMLASNTSGIPITALQAVCTHKTRVIGMHWSNPPHVIPVVEVIAGEHTGPAYVQRLCKIVTDCGLKPIVVKKDVAGFVHNRVLYALLRECVALVDQDVIVAEELDTLVKFALGLKLSVLGPMELLDVAGLDIYEAVAGYLNKELDASSGVPTYVTSRTKAKRLGMKTGGGIYAYTPERIRQLRLARAARMVGVRKVMDD
jgi:3-hydroxybutyryl-CoA dehydrogenase/5-formyl-3-hydroxy-2-methylpyridine 4-carboxylate dehydrogenase